MDRLDVYRRALDGGIVPMFYCAEPTTAIEVVRALDGAGAGVIEFTNRGPAALDVFGQINAARLRGGITAAVGIGSIFDAYTAALFIANGADFIVSPVFDAETARLCNRRKIAYVPGCGSIREIGLAEEAGAEIVKLFPSESLGPPFIRAALGPSPWSRLMPSGGIPVRREAIHEWISSGAACLGIGSSLVSHDVLTRGDMAGVSQHTAELLSWVAEARSLKGA